MPIPVLKNEITLTKEHLAMAIATRVDHKICTTCILAVGIAMENSLPIGSISVGFSSCSVFESIKAAQDPNNYTTPRCQYDFTGANDIAATFDCQMYDKLELMLPRTLIFTRTDREENENESAEETAEEYSAE